MRFTSTSALLLQLGQPLLPSGCRSVSTTVLAAADPGVRSGVFHHPAAYTTGPFSSSRTLDNLSTHASAVADAPGAAIAAQSPASSTHAQAIAQSQRPAISSPFSPHHPISGSISHQQQQPFLNPAHSPYSTYAASSALPSDSDYASAASYTSDPPPDSEPSRTSDSEILNQLLDTALDKHVPRLGWTHAALVAAAHELNLSPAVVGLIPLGEGALVLRLGKKFTAKLAKELRTPQRARELAALPLEGRIAMALQLRLRMLVPYLENWPQAMAVLARPAVAPAAVESLGKMVDEIWHAVGDKATDSSWYTKRALLFSVYYSMELYILTDYSPDFADTWAALDRRLHDTMRIFNTLHGTGGTRGPGMPGPGQAALNNLAESAKSVLGALQPPPGPWDAVLPRRA